MSVASAAVLCAACLLSDGASQVRAAQVQAPDLLRQEGGAATAAKRATPRRDAALETALARAWKRDFIEEGIAETRNTLIACQRQTSLLQIMPFMRSEGQQAHCFRF